MHREWKDSIAPERSYHILLPNFDLKCENLPHSKGPKPVCNLLNPNNNHTIKNLMEEYKVYKQYEAQLNSIKHQEEEKQAKIKEETEKKKKERNPQLTDIRKTKYGYYL